MAFSPEVAGGRGGLDGGCGSPAGIVQPPARVGNAADRN